MKFLELPLVNMAAGAAITLAVSHYYYSASGADLEREAADLRRMQHIMLVGMETAGWVTLTRDGGGRITGYTIELNASALGEASGSARLEVGGPATLTPPDLTNAK